MATVATLWERIKTHSVGRLVVVENEGSRKLAGILGRRDILSLYQDRVRQRGN